MKLPHFSVNYFKLWSVTFVHALTFVLLLICYLFYKFVVQQICTWTAFGYWHNGRVRRAIVAGGLALLRKLDIHESDSISRLDLIDLSMRHLRLKRTRSLITIGGMSVGIAVIVFLVSVGYGLENLVISRIARLDEMSQAEVTVEPGSRVLLDDKALADFKNISQISHVLPQISAIGKVTFNASESDMPVYGVPADYLRKSALTLAAGQMFTNNDLQVEAGKISTVIEPTVSQTTVAADKNEAGNEEPALAIPLASVAVKQAVINSAMLDLLGLSANEAVGERFMVSYSLNQESETGELVALASLPAEYEIVGVTTEDENAYFYIPFIDLRSLGVSRYSQVKIVVEKPSDLAAARQQIQVLGYTTESVVDTVAQVNNLFATFRTILVVLGLGALFVACLGMFNTLTVSLLERTREVGLMKSMGMRSFEVRELFLTESMIMGLFGGLLGVFLGFVGGKLLSLVISIFSLSQGGSLVDVSKVPWDFAILIMAVAIGVGFLTGIYPSRRATRISALNALRYE